ncbi:MAG: hypothetical protein PWP65_1103 [Clostridia bacterium]|nr:hypothetical protein [Clostridia bacterium]
MVSGATPSRTTNYLMQQLEAVDRVTATHSFAVAELVWRLCAEIGFGGGYGWLYEAGLLHDIGKMYIPRSVLMSRKVFTPAERRAMEAHVTYTGQILKYYRYHPAIIEACEQHHERLDGSGYPRGLTGEGLSAGGRLIAVADVFSALVSPRPYRGALPVRKALDIVMEEAYKGKLDAEIAGYLLKVIANQKFDLIRSF